MSPRTPAVRSLVASVSLTVALTAAATGAAPTASATTDPSASSASVTTSAAAPNPQDLAYLDFAARANLAEVAMGQLAKRQGHSAAVRDFGREMVRDHRRQYRALEVLAETVGVRLPSQPSRDQRRLVRLWSDLEGKAFSCAYVPFQWGDHQLVIAQTEKEVLAGADPLVTQSAAASLPVLQEHLGHATGLLRRLGRC